MPQITKRTATKKTPHTKQSPADINEGIAQANEPHGQAALNFFYNLDTLPEFCRYQLARSGRAIREYQPRGVRHR